jgi:hypothetical protein
MEVEMRRLLITLSLAALLVGVMATAAQTAGPGMKGSSVNFGKVQAGTLYTATLSLTNNTGETIINVAAPAVSDPFVLEGTWNCGGIIAHATCTSLFSFWTDLALMHGTNRITQSVTLTGTGATSGNTYTAVVKFIATQVAR